MGPYITGLTAVCIATLFNTIGCSFYYQSESTHTRDSIYDAMPSCPLKNVQLAVPTVGLFIGVSNYGERSQVWTTPAHSISAAMYREIFVKASDVPQGGFVVDPFQATELDPNRRRARYAGTDSLGETVILQYTDGSVHVKGVQVDYKFTLPTLIRAAFPTIEGHVIALLEDNTVVRWSTGENKLTLIAEVPESANVLVDSSERWIVVYDHNEVRVYDTNIGFTKPAAIWRDDCITGIYLDVDRDQIIIAACKTIKVYSLVDLEANPMTFDGSLNPEDLAFAQETNSIALRRPDNHLVIIEIDEGRVISDHKFYGQIPPMFALSGDGKLLVAQDNNLNQLKVYKVTPKMEEKASFHEIGSVNTKLDTKSIRFSLDGQSFSYILENGEVGVWTQNYRSPLVRLRLSQPALLARFAGDGERVRVVDLQSQLQTFLYRHPGNIKSGNKLTLLADLRLDPEGSLGKSTDWQLSRIVGMRGYWNRYRDVWADRAERNGGWAYIGKGEPVTKARIKKAIAQSLDEAELTVAELGRVLLVFYMSAHGWIGPDGKTYVLPADADYDDPATWMTLEVILEPIARFLNAGKTDTAIRRAIVVIDSCQNVRSDVPITIQETSFNTAGEGYVIITTSPGEYAWHWTAVMEVSGYQFVTKSIRLGFPPKPKPKQGPFLKRLSSNMSSFPLASKCSISRYFDSREGKERGWIGPADWFARTRNYMKKLIDTIPEVRQTGAKQNLKIHTMNVMWNEPIFKYNAPYKIPTNRDVQ